MAATPGRVFPESSAALQYPAESQIRNAGFPHQPWPCCEHGQSVSSGRTPSDLKGKKKTNNQPRNQNGGGGGVGGKKKGSL